MGCFSTCFGNCKRSRRRRRRNGNTNPSSLLHHLQTYESVEGFQVPHLIKEQEEEEKGENQIEFTPDSKEEKIEKANSSERKKVTFDLNVKIYEDLRTEEELDVGFEGNEEEEKDERVEIKEEKSGFRSQCSSDSSSSSLFSFPTDHRYRNCRDSDDEFDELSSDESEIDDDYTDDEEDDEVESENQLKCQEQSSESLFSLSLDSRKQGFESETGDKEVNSPMPIKNSSNKDSNSSEFDENAHKYVDSVLNPVENLSQWKFIKARSKLASKDQSQAKENVISLGQDFSFPVKKAVVSEREIGVDTSLSSWLMCSEGTPKNNSRSSSVSVGNSPSGRKTCSCSPNKFEDRPILGVLTLEELRQHSATSSPRKSPSKNPDDIPIIGTVGSYWSHTEQTTNSGSSTKSTKSRFRESAEVIWDATPFETRLEKALEKEGSEQIVAM
ncbi:DNA polymerase alpha catalytic subunit-like [Chenopodium quinoa]|uniref:DNA polymerase alpha catalytic subunit-like n=1 Tax=Chenopodium quinoa TaxID=63459 RepID=UPI000B779C76|nr:DNA polymerase alpha catalytic subunit-like [Chenopodium quinoa]